MNLSILEFVVEKDYPKDKDGEHFVVGKFAEEEVFRVLVENPHYSDDETIAATLSELFKPLVHAYEHRNDPPVVNLRNADGTWK